MPEIVTLGETMAVMVPRETGPLRYVSDFRLRMAGAESNTAIGAAKLGHTAGWISAVGADALGEYVLSAIRAEGVDVSAVKTDPDHRTGLMLKELSRGETAVYYYRENSAASCFSDRDIPWDFCADARLIHLSGITPVLSESCRKAAAAMKDYAKRTGKLLSFDPNVRKKLWKGQDYGDMIREFLLSADIALLGRDEARMLLGTEDPKETVRILKEKGVRCIAVKDGAQGAFCADTENFVHIPPEPCRPVDPVGAGDGFNAAFLAGILEGRDLLTCGRMGAIAGAMATENAGDTEGYPTRQQMDARLTNTDTVFR